MCLERYSLNVSQNVNTWGNISVNGRLGTKTEKKRMEEEIFVIYSRSSLGKIFLIIHKISARNS